MDIIRQDLADDDVIEFYNSTVASAMMSFKLLTEEWNRETIHQEYGLRHRG